MPLAGPTAVGRLLPAFTRSRNSEVGKALVEGLQGSVHSLGLRIEVIRPILDGFGPDIQDQAQALYAEIEAGTAARQARMEEMLGSLDNGDTRRGQVVFNSPKAACSSCHAIGYLGGQVGPDLTRIGGIRAERDLLESIVEPSASFVQTYEPMLVATTDGRVLNGLLRGDDGDAIVLATGTDEQVRVPRQEIEEMQPGTVSVMPSGLDQQLSPRELADLIAFLKSLK